MSVGSSGALSTGQLKYMKWEMILVSPVFELVTRNSRLTYPIFSSSDAICVRKIQTIILLPQIHQFLLLFQPQLRRHESVRIRPPAMQHPQEPFSRLASLRSNKSETVALPRSGRVGLHQRQLHWWLPAEGGVCGNSGGLIRCWFFVSLWIHFYKHM